MSEVKKAAAQAETTVKKAEAQAEKAVKKAGEGKLSKILNWFKALPQRISKPFKNMFYELKKVTWPSKRDMVNYCIVVFAFMIVMGLIIGLFDLGASALVDLIIS